MSPPLDKPVSTGQSRAASEKDPAIAAEDPAECAHDDDSENIVNIREAASANDDDFYEDQIDTEFYDDDVIDEEDEAIDDDDDDDEMLQDDDDDEDDSLMRLSEQYRRFSRSRSEHLDDEEEEDDDDDSHDDMMRSIHRQSHENDDANDDTHDIMNHIAALTGRTLPTATPQQPPRDLSEAMSRIFPEAASFFGGFGGAFGNNNIVRLIDQLTQRDNSYILLETLNQLSERLLMMNGISAERSIPAYKLSKNLVDILQDPILMEELELQLVACRCLYNFLEVNTDFVHEAISNGAIEVLCSKLFEISYIDLAEQALQTLEMISRTNSSHNQIINKNGLSACLTYLDFFTIHAQRKALIITANSCSNIQPSNFELIRDIFPTLENVVLNYSDATVVENCWLAISRIIMSFKTKPDLLESLFIKEDGSRFLQRLVSVVINDNSITLSFSTILNLLRSLIVLVGTSVPLSLLALKDCNLGDVILKSFSKYTKERTNKKDDLNMDRIVVETTATVSIEALMNAPKELILQFLNLISYMLPISYNSKHSAFLKKNFHLNKTRKSLNEERITTYNENSDKYYVFVNKIWPLLINIYSATVDYEVRRRVLINLSRIATFCGDDEQFRHIKDVEIITSLLASIVIQSKSVIKKTILESLKEEKIDSKEYEEEDNEEEEDDDDNEEDNEDDEEEDEDNEEDDEDEDDHPFETNNSHHQTSRHVTENLSKLYPNVLLLGALSLTQILIEKSPGMFLASFEREGLISDTESLLEVLRERNNALNGSELEEDEEMEDEDVSDSDEASNGFNYSYINHYIDLELSKEYEYDLQARSLLKKLLFAGSRIEAEYLNLKTSGKDVDSERSDHVQVLADVMAHLHNIESIRQFGYENWIQSWIQLKQAFNSNISSFELISSGIIECLLAIFKSPIGLEGTPCYKAFVEVFFKFDPQNEKNQDGEVVAELPIALLVFKLQEALTRSETFDIVSSGPSTGNYQALNTPITDSSRTTAMAKQIKLKLIVNDEETSPDEAIEDDEEADEEDHRPSNVPQNLKQLMLSVHAIATFKSINNFLDHRINILSQLTRGLFNANTPSSSSGNVPSYIEFSINGEVIPHETTIYGAIYKSLQKEPDEIVDPSLVWTRSHVIKYRKLEGDVAILAQKQAQAADGENNHQHNSYSLSGETELAALNDGISVNILQLLKVLFGMNLNQQVSNGLITRAPDSIFLNWKLTAKLNRQLEEPLVVASGTLPGWSVHITRQFPFIFPLDTRIFFLQSTSFGYSRLIHKWQQRTNQENNQTGGGSGSSNGNGLGNNSNSDNGAPQLGRPNRHKVRLSRNHLLQSAVKVMNLYGSHPSVLEIEYFDEVGTGLGPTLEFYANVSREFAKKKLNLWRGSHEDIEADEYVNYKTGLFPSPLDKKNASSDHGKRVLQFFAMLGKFLARGLLDSRILDFHFNPFFFQLANYISETKHSKAKFTNREYILEKVKLIDPDLGRSLLHLNRYVTQIAQAEIGIDLDEITVDSCTLEELSLTYSLPGYPEIEMIENGDNVLLTSANVTEYIDQVIDLTLFSGVKRQIKAFIEGFSKVFPYSSMIIFSQEETANLFGNGDEDWSYETLASSIHANHGFSSDSESIQSLLRIMCHFDKRERREFLQFITGAPKLPIGGFKALRPELTVVRKHSEEGLKDDDYLPSVMTCANYLKLPKYSDEAVMKSRIGQAMSEGAGSFLLS